jgi:hypothetical protein
MVAYPVNRDGQPVSGVPGYTSIEAISGDVDLAVIASRLLRWPRHVLSHRYVSEAAVGQLT